MKNRYERGELLRKAREEKGYTQLELAELLNYSNKTLSKWETGESYPTDYGTLKKYASLLDLDINEIVDGRTIDNKYKIKIGKLVIDIRELIKIVFTILFTIFIMLLLFYIVYNHFEKGKIKVYDLKIESNNISLSNHVLFVSNNISILDFAKIEGVSDINELELYYMKNTKKISIFKGSNIGYRIKDKNNSEYNISDLENKEVFLDIYYKSGIKEKYKVYFIEEYVNDKVYSINKELSNSNSIIECNKLYRYGFINKNGICTKEFENDKISYNERTKSFTYNIYKDNKNIVIEKILGKDDYIVIIIDMDGNINSSKYQLMDILNKNDYLIKYIKDLYYYEKVMFSL